MSGNTPPFVCLVTPGHVASTPRLVKNADALAEAGYRVHVVAGRHFAPVDPLDAEVLRAARWSHTTVDYCGGAAAALRKLLRRLARRLIPHVPFATARLAARAHHAETLHLAAVAARQPAGLFLGHCLAGLPAAALAAQARNVPYGFDAEDFHDADTVEATTEPAERIARHVLQSTLLPGCACLTAASPLIGREYADTYALPPPITLLNVFPLAQAPAAPVDPGPVTGQRPARCYWFSQTVGPGRGLEAVVAILGHMRTPVELHLRGFASPDYITRLQSRAAKAGLPRPIRFLPPGPPGEMARLAAGADLGLSTEESQPLSRDLCLTNKIFVYLLAGIPQLLSHTTAQAALAPELGAAALLCDLSRSEDAARNLDAFFADPARVAAARDTSWQLARRRFCWDVEKTALLRSVGKILPR